MTYGAETLTLTKQAQNTLAAAHSTYQHGKKYAQHHIQVLMDQHLDQSDDKSHRQYVRKMK